ncbi:MAG TPA: hypothetical protein V6C65_04460 [Allocoleopsis sp.]
MDQAEARKIPADIAVCPICGKGIWIDSINEMTQGKDGDRWLPNAVDISCEGEPDIDSAEWREWHNWHYAMPYVDWLPISTKVLDWLQKPEQQERVELITGADHNG